MTALPVYDAVKHHIGLAPVLEADGTVPSIKGFMLDGGYLRSGQQLGSPTDFGAEQDLISTPILSRWSQNDYTGGAYAPTWGKDPAMFAQSTNIIPSQQARSVRTVPPLHRSVNFSGAGTRVPKGMFVADGYLFVTFACGVARFGLNGEATELFGPGVAPFLTDERITWACFDKANHELLISHEDGSIGGITRYAIPSLAFASGTVVFYGQPVNGDRPIRRFTVAGSQLLAQSGQSLWSMNVPDDKDSAFVPGTAWTNRGRLPGLWKDSVNFNGQTYILCSDADDGTTVVVWDPALAAILPVADIPFSLRGDSIAVLGGRVYVGGSGVSIAGTERHAELYEITGASVRLVRTFEPESRGANIAHAPKTIRSMVAHEGLLFFGDKGRGLVAYDPTTDSLYGSSLFLAPDGAKEVYQLCAGRERLHCYVTNPLNVADNGVYRQCVTAADLGALTYEGTVTTSDFSEQPDRKKRWGQMKILTRYGTAALGYSLTQGAPGGDTFTTIIASGTEQIGDLYYTTFDLSAVPTSAHIRFHIRLPRGTAVTTYTELIAHTCSFAFLDSGKWSWQMTVNGTARVESHDGEETLLQDVHDIGDELRRYWSEQLPLRYRDLDGEEYKVVLSRFQESQPVIGRAYEMTDTEFNTSVAQEAFFAITLTQV